MKFLSLLIIYSLVITGCKAIESESEEIVEQISSQKPGCEILVKRLEDNENKQGSFTDPQLYLQLMQDAARSRAKSNSKDALKTYEDALSALCQTRITQPDTLLFQHDNYFIQVKIDDIKISQRRKGETLAFYKNGVEIRRNLLALDTKNTAYQRSLASSLGRLGNRLSLEKDIDGASDAYLESLAIMQNMANTNPNNMFMKRDVSVNLGRIGLFYFRNQNYDLALKASQESLSIGEALEEANSKNTNYPHDNFLNLDRIGNIYMKLGDLDQAFLFYEKSLLKRRELASRNPDHMPWQRDISVGLMSLGSYYMSLQKPERAKPFFEEALQIRLALKRLDPETPSRQVDIDVTRKIIASYK